MPSPATTATTASPAPIEAASLPARPSIPSMKLNRLMNHSQQTAATIRSSQNGSQPWNTSEPAGNAVSPIATAAICIPNRSRAERLRRSSIQDIAIRPTDPAIAGSTWSKWPTIQPISAMAGSRVSMIPQPPPRGVGILWLLRSLGWSRIALRRR